MSEEHTWNVKNLLHMTFIHENDQTNIKETATLPSQNTITDVS